MTYKYVYPRRLINNHCIFAWTHTIVNTANPACLSAFFLVTSGTMPRKFRLCVQGKNEFRKVSAVTVSVQQVSVAPAALCIASDKSTFPKSVKKFTVSLPIDLICDFEVSSVTKLRERIKTSSPLPQGTFYIECMGYALIIYFFPSFFQRWIIHSCVY